MSATPFMPLWVSDFLGDTLDLDAAEIGAYMLLLMAQWNRGGRSLPADHKKLQRVARCGRNWVSVWGSIERYFESDDDGIYSKRLRFEAQNVASKREVNARNGALGGTAKALKSKDQPLANGTNSLERNATIPEPEPDKIKRDTSVSPKKPRQKASLPEGWVPSEANISHAFSKGFSQRDIDHEADRFRDHHLARGSIFKDWDAAWRTWVANAIKFSGGRMVGAANSARYGQGSSLASIAAQRRLAGEV